MLRPHRFGVLIGAALLAAFLTPLASAQTPEPVARAVLFFSPTCGHCEFVIQEVMPTWFEEYGGITPDVYFDESTAAPPFFLVTNGMLEFLLVDVTIAEGFAMFEAATEAWAIGNEAVPRLIIGREVAIGSADIPERVPPILDQAFAADGIAWPDIDGVAAVVDRLLATAAEPPATTTTTVGTTTTIAVGVEQPVLVNLDPLADVIATDSIGERFGRDPVGNSAAVVVLIGMVATLALLARRRGMIGQVDPRWIALLAAAGMAVATYLAAIESSGAEALCGPVGDCNAVQQSQYASVFGIPVGAIGIVGYAVMLLAWFRADRDDAAGVRARYVLVGAAAAGVVFSIYLTFLEPFVIGATCVWCLTSAILVTLILVVATPYAVTDRPTELRADSGVE
jgi:uncharacterized membrane protein